jgi:hypothetical protein
MRSAATGSPGVRQVAGLLNENQGAFALLRAPEAFEQLRASGVVAGLGGAAAGFRRYAARTTCGVPLAASR